MCSNTNSLVAITLVSLSIQHILCSWNMDTMRRISLHGIATAATESSVLLCFSTLTSFLLACPPPRGVAFHRIRASSIFQKLFLHKYVYTYTTRRTELFRFLEEHLMPPADRFTILLSNSRPWIAFARHFRREKCRVLCFKENILNGQRTVCRPYVTAILGIHHFPQLRNVIHRPLRSLLLVLVLPLVFFWSVENLIDLLFRCFHVSMKHSSATTPTHIHTHVCSITFTHTPLHRGTATELFSLRQNAK